MLPRDSQTNADWRPTRDMTTLRAVNLVLRQRAAIAGCAVLAATVVVALGLTSERRYTSTASFAAQSRRATRGGSISGIAAQFGVALPAQENDQNPQYYVDLVRSRSILWPTLQTRMRARMKDEVREGALLDLMNTPPNPDSTGRLIDGAKELNARLSVQSSVKTGVITLTATMPSADVARLTAARIIELINKFNLETRQTQAAAERRFTERRLAEGKTQLRAAEDALQQFLLRNRELGSPDLAFARDRLAREVQMQQQLYTSLTQAFEQAKIDEVRDTPVLTIIDAPHRPDRPDSRGTIRRGMIALLLGALAGLLIGLVRELRRHSGDADELQEFGSLLRETAADVRNPIRPIRRLLRGGDPERTERVV